jgi:hypothetical protein
MYRGVDLNRLADSTGAGSREWDVGRSGLNGHEACVEAPPGTSFFADPHCTSVDPDLAPGSPPPVLFEPGRCVWSDADCSKCTGIFGRETVVRWTDPGGMPPQPDFRLVPGDHRVRIEWDNMPEVLFKGNIITPADDPNGESRFLGYRVWKMQDWRGRESLLPDRDRWSLVASFAYDTLFGQKLLSSATDSTLDYERIIYETPHYPVGRYRFDDPDVLNGFDYLYVVTSYYEARTRTASGTLTVANRESPLDVAFGQRVVPAATALPRKGAVWVVPNPFRARADWDRPKTLGDPLTRHIDFMGLPQAQCVIKIWTLAGDFVAQVDHDGSGGHGQASWNLVTRNGQETESGIYLFTVDSKYGHQVGRFVVIR